MATTQVRKMGFVGKIFCGNTGSTAATELTNSRDITYTHETDDGETTTRGDGSAPPIETMRPVKRRFSIEWQMLNKTNDTALAFLLDCAYGATDAAIRTLDSAAGKGFDGDCYIKVKHGKPLNGEQTFDFTAIPNNNSREPSPYV